MQRNWDMLCAVEGVASSLYYHVNTFKPRTDRGNWVLSLHLRDLRRERLSREGGQGRKKGGGRRRRIPYLHVSEYGLVSSYVARV